ncbi:PREDICTED: olfactory receptor 1019-like [Nanorana parkeri]|uniref:olfactory receptor 1019-like n=1 Tax=Nanorana parkeri TaxID=125878 RepID=UPI000853FF7F|nr:PREDICTED: olfactory receptor 1019-like [Nanorana parkeri]
MNILNKTQVTVFEFSGLSNNKAVAPFLFVLFFLVYMVTICGNIGMMAIVHISPSLHTPMYYFLSYLSMVDLFYSSVIAPKMLSDLLLEKKLISFLGCALQFFFFAALASSEVFVLSDMSYDRYVAICHPLHYISIMTKKKCLGLVILSFSVGFIQSSAQTSSLFSLEYCESNLIDHFYCDIPPLVRLSCSETRTCNIVTLFFVCFCSLSSMTIILVSYALIISSILRINSAAGRRKAFSTCSSHLMCASIFYVTVFFTYLHPSSSTLGKQDKVSSVFYTVVTPMLNPLIYSLRNQEVKKVIISLVQKSANKNI